MHVVLVVPGGVDPARRERTIPAIVDLVDGLGERGHRVTVVALGHDDRAARFALGAATVRTVPAEARGPHRLARMVARGVRAVGAEGHPDVVHGLWASVSGLVAVLGARRHRVPSLVHVAGGELVALPDIAYGGALGRGGRAVTAAALRGAGTVTVASEWMARHVRAAGHRVDAIVPLGVHTARFTPAPAGTVAGRLVHVGSLNGVKDQATLLRAFARIRRERPEATLALAGVDTTGGAVARLADELGLRGAATFHGYVPPDELPAFLRGADLHVLSSRHDAGPVAVLEAAACGVPTVGTAVGHVADLAAAAPPGASAVAVGDAPALAAAVVALVGDRARRDALAVVARGFALANDRRATAARFDALYGAR